MDGFQFFAPNGRPVSIRRAETTEELKRLWDDYDGMRDPKPGLSGEEIHLELNLRGEGEYCAV